MSRSMAMICVLVLGPAACAWCFPVDDSPQPADHPPLSPDDGATVSTNPPSMIWRVDERAATYTLEMCQRDDFAADVIRVEGIDMPFYNHSTPLAEGTWYWRYFVLTPEGELSEPGPVRSFLVTADAPLMPVPPTAEILRTMPEHPRIFVTPDTLAQFRARRNTVAREAWEDIRHRAEEALGSAPPELELRPMPADPGSARKQVFVLRDGEPTVPVGYTASSLNADASKANVLSLAYLISADKRYAEAARRWLAFIAPFRMDYHLEDRGQHDTVVYNYEYGLKGVALAYDRLYDLLSEQERQAIVAHLEYHCANAYKWCHDALKLHLNYQNSHGQQCMHALLTTVLAIADEDEQTAKWADWLIRQYVNRIAWGDEDGGYTEGQTYGHKFQFILEGLAALKTATGIDVFVKPRLRNAGDFWMYCMSLNYWWNHGGDVYSLLIPVPGSSADTYIAGFLASMTGSRYVTWWSDTVLGSPSHIPLWYLSSTGIAPKPPVDIAQARVFPDVGQLAAHDRFYDHRSPRIFFRSSPWGGHSHAHADQNGFVLHAGGQILAPEAGYYTYAGDTYHRSFSVTTAAHNSILVNGEGQPKSIEAKGRIAAFLNSADYCLFMGEAARAYPEVLDQFDRFVLFVRPDVFLVYDELQAPQPAEFAWMLNSFEPAQIDEAACTMILRQSDQRLRVRHLAPEGLRYTQSNERPFPMLTKAWCRYTEAFPQPYNIRVIPAQQRAKERILAVMDSYAQADGPALRGLQRIAAEGALAVRFTRGAVTETALCRERAQEPVAVGADGIQTDARVASVGRHADGAVVRWLLHGGTRLSVDGAELFRADALCDAAAQMPSPSGLALVQVKPTGALTVALRLPERPRAVFAAPPNLPAQARRLAYSWRDGMAHIDLPGRETVLWVDPVLDLTEPTPPLQLTVTDGAGRYTLSLETAIAENGEIVAFGCLDPREPGLYSFTASEPASELLVQDRWDITSSERGTRAVRAPWREAAELFVRWAPGATPRVRAVLRQSYRGELVSLLRNGGFEEGSPGYPPRTWVVWHPRQMGFSWPFWSQEDATEGRSCLKLVRPEIPIALTSQPMRLRTGGIYQLRFMARGNATQAKVTVSGQLGTGGEALIEPSHHWREYRTEMLLAAGYTTVRIDLAAGGDPDQVLWVDDVQFGYVPQ
ncbi:MAG: DUF4962 domain-containing protein [Armatimonadota bacterium]